MEMGIGNITANNGWAMFVVGYATVIVALTVLATLISLMPKIILIQEALNPFGKKKEKPAPVPKAIVKPKPEETLPGLNVAAIVAEYGPFVGELEAPFALQQVYAIAKEKDLEHPHLSVRTLLETGKIVQESDGLFKWNA